MFTWVLLSSKVSAQYIILVKFFPPSLPPFKDEVWALFCAMPSNKLGTLLGGAVRSAQRLPPSVLAALPFNGEFTQQDGRKKRTAKRLSVTNVTGILLACFVGNSLNIVVFSSSTKRFV